MLGFLWSFITPLMLMMTYVLVFSIFMRIQMDNFAAYLLSGILPWMCFTTGLVEATNSIISNAGLIKRISLPSQIFPLVNILTNAVHFIFSIPILILFLVGFRIDLSWALLLFPVVLFIQLLFTYGLALFISSLVVQFRDFLYIVPNLLMIWMFLTPIIYPVSMVPEKFRPLLNANPMTHIAEAYHAIFYYGRLPSPGYLTGVALISLVLVLLGLSFFESRKDMFAEEI